ncbi:MAG: hypothetical protein HC780_21255 [Leptolyngbyaceae cyanobacterium CSU_1_3]|nr:hypothetical protein [Leptolyngbyaceae cyanobacterium CSU_1_3]
MAKEGFLGAGGSWRVIDEYPDSSVIKQFNDDACAAACGEMLLRDHGVTAISQREIADSAGGVPMEIPILARCFADTARVVLNQIGNLPGRWIGAAIGIENATNEELLRTLSSIGSWGAGLWEDGAPIGHIVLVDGLNENNEVLIRDPWGMTRSARQGSRYKMELQAFLKVWSRQVVYRVEP